MQQLFRYISLLEPTRGISKHDFNRRYAHWDMSSRQIQISAISFLTAVLYVAFAFLEKPWASEQVEVLMFKLHIFVNVPLLLGLSFLAYKQRFYRYVMPSFAALPIVSMSCHAVIASKLVNYTPFAPEAYLGVVWIFVVSGMTFRYALISAITALCILAGSAFYFIEQQSSYVMHVFWLACSFSFGFLGALMLDRSRKQFFVSQQELQHLAVTDPLTGLYNRNQLNIVLNKEMAREQRYNRSFGLLVIDVDFFKRINDSFGHEAGDNVLKQISQDLLQTVRKNDTVIRWGGEEFIVVASEVDKQSIVALSENLCKKIEGSEFNGVGRVTVSIGATLCKLDDTPSDLLSRADKALYKAKETGRNIAIYTS